MTDTRHQAPSPVAEDDDVRGGFAPAAGPPDLEIQSVLSTDDGSNDSDEAVRANTTNRLEIFRYLTRYSSLDRVLESPHITGMLGYHLSTLRHLLTVDVKGLPFQEP
jgi:hypothetical protein